MKTVLLRRRPCSAFLETRIIAAAALSLFFGACIMSASGHAQSLPQTVSSSLEARDLPAQELFNEAVTIEREGKGSEKAIAKYDEVMHRYARAPTSGSRQFAARALLNKGALLNRGALPSKGGTLEERNEMIRDAIITFDRVERNFGNEKSLPIRVVLASALASKAEALYRMGETEKTLATYSQLERNFGNEKSPDIRVVLASALVSKAETFYGMGDAKKTLAAYDQLHQQFGKDDNDFIKRLTDIAKWRAIEIRRSNNNMVLSSRP
ncbi:MAG: hypothetical protein FWH56_01470 [Betaproteobacteria bacterium]|nr:hypothetical protein [Betaproteobacteria bacterium]